jgi:hypothetical protein
MTSAIAAIGVPPPPAGASSQAGLGGLLAALRAIVADPPAMPSVQSRIDAILRRIPAGEQRVVIWVRGTNEREIKPAIRAAFERELPDEPVLEVDYQASWRFGDSVPDGEAVLRGVLEALGRRRPRPKVLLAGESQGAWVISTVLADPRMSPLVTRAVLWGAPAAAPLDFADGHDRRIREYNNDGDIVTMDFGRDTNTGLVGGIDRFARREYAGGLVQMLGHAITHPAVIGALLAAQLWRVPVIGKRFPSPHGYDFLAGVRFLRDGRDEAAAA